MKVKDLIEILKTHDPENVVMMNFFDDGTGQDYIQPFDNDGVIQSHCKGPFFNREMSFKTEDSFQCTFIGASYDYDGKEKD